MTLPPSGAGAIEKNHGEVWKAYQELGKACFEAGSLDPQTRRLVKLALSIGARSEGAVHSHTRQALEEGVSVDELRQIALFSITTLGFPAAMAAYSWINDIVET